jgi:hypothetical protein
MARSQMQRQCAGDSRLPYTAFSHDKSQLGHRVIVSGEPFRRRFTQMSADWEQMLGYVNSWPMQAENLKDDLRTKTAAQQ